MLQTLEAVVDEHGNVRVLGDVKLPVGRRVLITVLREGLVNTVDEVTLLSEAALAEDWNRREEDVAWSHLQPEQ